MNLAVSSVLAGIFHFGIVGILLGTAFSNIFVLMYEPFVVAQKGLQIEKNGKHYYCMLLKNYLTIFGMLLLMHVSSYMGLNAFELVPARFAILVLGLVVLLRLNSDQAEYLRKYVSNFKLRVRK